MSTVTYPGLLAETRPERIETEAQFDAAHARFGELFAKRTRRTAAENKLMGLLGVLIQDYDQRHALPDDSTPAELLQFLVEQSGQPAASLLAPIFGSRSHVHEALTGKRPISAIQARKLGQMFQVSPGIFI